jgi:polyhydroxybutyrate depolymerase
MPGIKRSNNFFSVHHTEKQFVILISIVLLVAVSCETTKTTRVYSEFEYGNEMREYIYHSPSNLKPGSPLVVAVHGYTDDAYSFMNYTSLNHLADSMGFTVCYPRGSVDSKGNRFWYAGYSFHQDGDIKDDCGFVESLAIFLQKKYKLDPDRTFITGMSNGGDLCVKIACQGSGVFKAYAPVVGCMMKIVADSSHYDPVPLLFINGTADSTTYFKGDISNKQGYGVYWGTDEMIRYFLLENNCNHVITDTIYDAKKTDSTFAIRYLYTNKESAENPVLFYKIVGGRHDWPGSTGYNCINASQEIASFFMNLSLLDVK